MIIWVDAVTLWVAHMAGYAGVMMSIRCERSPGYNCLVEVSRLYTWKIGKDLGPSDSILGLAVALLQSALGAQAEAMTCGA